MERKFGNIMTLVIIVAGLFGSAFGQRMKHCDIRPALSDNTKVDVHCDCMQRLTETSLKIDHLTINQTGCSETGLELSWPALETMVAPEVLILVGAQVFFSPRTTDEPWEASIKELEFSDCQISELPGDVFKGMFLLEDVRFINTAIEIIKANAFSELSELKTVEIAFSSITRIEENAFNNLQALEDLAITYSTIGSIESGAITLLQSQDSTKPRCPGLGRSMAEPKEMIGGIMGRELTTIGNQSLPDYGTRLFLFKNNIITINSKAINTETLGFLIAGGNHFITVEAEAFHMELYNECEISASVFVGNTFETVQSLAFKGLRGKDGSEYQTFLALANNNFVTVFDQSFKLSENLVVFAVEQNTFECTCENLGWIINNQNENIARELEKEIVSKAVCTDGTSLISFTSSCTVQGNPTTIVTEMTPDSHSLPSVETTTTDTNAGSTITFASSLFILVLFFLII